MSLSLASSGRWLLATILFAQALTAAHRTVKAQEANELGPQAGVLLLTNGQLLSGEITRAGDHYVVTIGVGGEARIEAGQVTAQCADLEAVYDWKLRRLSGEGAGPHLDLADWCLRQHLYRHCAQQLSLALAAEPNHPRIDELDRRLKLAVQAPPPTRSAPPVSTIVSSEELEKMLRELPKGSLERFSTIVQPMLNNRCATSHCHGATSTSEFRLLRPPAGLNPPQRFTHRNLYATLQYVDRQDPANSKLLTLTQEPHGGGKEPAFDARSKSQLADLQKWIEQLAPPKEPAIPATIESRGMQLSTPLRAASQTTQEASPTGTQLSTGASPDDNSPKVPERANVLPKNALPWKPRDPFDPEIFNRRQAAKK